MARETSAAEGCLRFEVEAGEEAREKLEARHDAALAIQDLYPGMGMMGTDVRLRSPLPAPSGHARDTIESRGLECAIPGQVRDGNCHAVPRRHGR